MKIAVASGKGGTGKTTVAASLLSVWEGAVSAVDLDVEEPNLHLFVNPEAMETTRSYMEVPAVDEDRCTYCGKCSALCQFKAISVFNTVVMTFPELCHGCGGCMRICPESAISPGRRELGEISVGTAMDRPFLMGRLRVGEAMSPPLMRNVLERLEEVSGGERADVIVDAPPGVSCPAVTAVMACDFVVLVTEPTPFGVYDLKLAHEAFGKLGKPMGVVINRAGVGDAGVYGFCRDADLKILAEIPYDRRIAEAYATGRIVATVSDALHGLFSALAQQVKMLAGTGTEEVPHA